MRRYIYIGIGGMMGSLSRYLISNIITEKMHTFLPINTFIINITGCFILGFFLTTVLEFIEMNSDYRLAISTGFTGSYTTFSTFTSEINSLWIRQNLFILGSYFILSVIVGILSIWLGIMASRKYFYFAAKATERED